jgi:hypothetical protein
VSPEALGQSVRLHIPSSPTERDHWRQAVLDGVDLAEVLQRPGGTTDWLWRRWRVLATAGLTREAFGAIVLGYRRELWLWMAGERTWAQCCAGLIGRIERRLPG